MIDYMYYSEYEDIPAMIEPKTMQDVVELFDNVKNEPVVATKPVLMALETLKTIRNTIKYLEEQERIQLDKIACHMLDKSQLITEDGEVIATWAKSSSSRRFNEKLFKLEHADLYQSFLEEREGSRRFLVK